MTTLEPALTRMDRLLGLPWVDKLIAVIAVLPFAWLLWVYSRMASWHLESILTIINFALITVTMLLRHPPKRVTRNPSFWLLALFASYWPFFFRAFYEAGERMAPAALTLTLVSFGLLMTIWARLSLGRNIGLVPAHRKIVSSGAYRWVRHPIYTGIFLSVVASTLADFSLRNLALNGIWMGLFAYKSLVEENFLKSSSTEYADYMQQVRWRWLPYVF